jgi:hypothetical protein
MWGGQIIQDAGQRKRKHGTEATETIAAVMSAAWRRACTVEALWSET